MLARARALQARALPHGPADAARQVALFAAAYYFYRLVRGLVDGRASAAFENARNLIDAERSLHIFVEPAIQGWAASSAVVIDVARWITSTPRPRSRSPRSSGCTCSATSRSTSCAT